MRERGDIVTARGCCNYLWVWLVGCGGRGIEGCDGNIIPRVWGDTLRGGGGGGHLTLG